MIVNSVVEVDSNLTYVTNKLIDVDFIRNVTKTAKNCEIVNGNFQEVGSVLRYTFEFGNKLYMQEQEILEIDLPNRIVFKSSLGKSITIQENLFEAKGGKTIWTQKTTYQLPFILKFFVKLFKKNAFIEDTKRIQEDMKNNIENYHAN